MALAPFLVTLRKCVVALLPHTVHMPEGMCKVNPCKAYPHADRRAKRRQLLVCRGEHPGAWKAQESNADIRHNRAEWDISLTLPLHRTYGSRIRRYINIQSNITQIVLQWVDQSWSALCFASKCLWTDFSEYSGEISEKSWIPRSRKKRSWFGFFTAYELCLPSWIPIFQNKTASWELLYKIFTMSRKTVPRKAVFISFEES